MSGSAILRRSVTTHSPASRKATKTRSSRFNSKGGSFGSPLFLLLKSLAESAKLEFSRVHPNSNHVPTRTQEVVLDRLKTTVITAFVMAVLFAPAAFAQATAAPAQGTAANVAVVSGNGQLICPVCALKRATSFHPMVVKVTGANGNPIAGKTVNWTLKSFMGGSQPSFDAVSTTNSDGLAFSRVSQNALQFGTTLLPFLQSVITATADNALANFTETIALTDPTLGTLFCSAVLIAPIGTPLTGLAGGTGTGSIQIQVGTGFKPFPGISVRILSPEVTSDGQVI